MYCLHAGVVDIEYSGVGRCFCMGGLHNKEIRACVLWFKGVHVRNHLFLGQFWVIIMSLIYYTYVYSVIIA